MEATKQSPMQPMEVNRVEKPARVADASKYNLRCNRNISEKMTQKDFIYDIPRPLQATRKLEEQKRRPIVGVRKSRIRKPKCTDAKITEIPLVSRALDFECNFCRESIATLFSLSTHVKSHLRRYCKKCYWILEEGETMEDHVAKANYQSYP